mmetsp:Transcript_138524/g.276146  ORF Transcript_138524/g.276146 Transcript_138524/m.276146 type:complete len:96 (-) Transcript_138524:545-832(-)
MRYVHDMCCRGVYACIGTTDWCDPECSAQGVLDSDPDNHGSCAKPCIACDGSGSAGLFGGHLALSFTASPPSLSAGLQLRHRGVTTLQARGGWGV